MVSECSQVYLLERHCDVREAMPGDNGVGIVAANVQANAVSANRDILERIDDMNDVLTVVPEAVLPPLQDWSNVVKVA